MKYLLTINPYTWDIDVTEVTPAMLGTSISGALCHIVVADNVEEALTIGQALVRDYQLNPGEGKDYFIVRAEDVND